MFTSVTLGPKIVAIALAGWMTVTGFNPGGVVNKSPQPLPAAVKHGYAQLKGTIFPFPTKEKDLEKKIRDGAFDNVEGDYFYTDKGDTFEVEDETATGTIKVILPKFPWMVREKMKIIVKRKDGKTIEWNFTEETAPFIEKLTEQEQLFTVLHWAMIKDPESYARTIMLLVEDNTKKQKTIWQKVIDLNNKIKN